VSAISSPSTSADGTSPRFPAPGSWQLTRRVADRRTGQYGAVTGTLAITAEPAGQRWREQGLLRWADRELPVSRELMIRRLDGSWWMTFADGRAFHPWRPGEIVTHPCAADSYRGLVELRGDRMRTLWDVTGPAKYQRLITRLRLVSPG
jgi:hypothetical protein